MADKTKEKGKTKEPKMVLEREYIVPLRSEWLKVAMHKRANRAMKALKQFLVKHMKIYDRDLRKIKIDQVLNNEMRFRGMKKPLSSVRVLAKKYDDDTVRVELMDVPEHVKFARIREEKMHAETKKKVSEIKKEEKPNKEDEEVKQEEEEKKEEAKEKEEASKEENLEIAKEQAREQKHVSKISEGGQAKQNIGARRAQRGR